jgi:galactosylceramidase
MGRVNDVGSGYGCVPKGYYLRLAADGACALCAASQEKNAGPGLELAAGTAALPTGSPWHNVKLQMDGDRLTGFVDGTAVLSATNGLYARGMAGLLTGSGVKTRNPAYFDNLLINRVGAPAPAPTVFARRQRPMY